MSIYKKTMKPIKRPSEPVLKTAEELVIMREAGRITALAHQAMRDALREGITTIELDQIAEAVIRDHGAVPAFLNYAPSNHPPYPATINASINDELVHGVPSADRVLKEGDIISLDTACIYKGYVGDAAFTYGIGKIKPAVKRLIEACEKALYVAIEQCIIGNYVSDIARSTEKFASKNGYSVALDYTGHGVGKQMHEPPQVPNWWPSKALAMRLGNRMWTDYPLQAGMTIAIEPMLIAGNNPLEEDKDDHWTVRTKDHSLCAHFEHTVVITEDNPMILTLL